MCAKLKIFESTVTKSYMQTSQNFSYEFWHMYAIQRGLTLIKHNSNNVRWYLNLKAMWCMNMKALIHRRTHINLLKLSMRNSKKEKAKSYAQCENLRPHRYVYITVTVLEVKESLSEHECS